ncbi:hypothetical protein DACRYDRAFT_24169 [Dacryopinax primogenitus]|uniref:Uncharacterized protein n=1 Tax=Dacryopinax primogenitus (strain DJM 731) TaxID=1858805 RepID=M5FUH1_DACPD|nr:uncharacterized protein DACRYDRAFT_24169 [Dacryopinax primogenitus]EJT99124.1 hypothetical protein DACRYDRAFT_24169 [Dacryopinax primogenitus]
MQADGPEAHVDTLVASMFRLYKFDAKGVCHQNYPLTLEMMHKRTAANPDVVVMTNDGPFMITIHCEDKAQQFRGSILYQLLAQCVAVFTYNQE